MNGLILNIKERGKCGGVAGSSLMALLDRFATLATRLDFLDVAINPQESHACHACHADKEDKTVSVLENRFFVGKKKCCQWLKIVMNEGHLEPSQPSVGRTVGWPQRKMFQRSLWTDFYCWFRKKKFPVTEMPEDWNFYELLDHLFIRHEDQYEFPPLEQCRATFASLRQHDECD